MQLRISIREANLHLSRYLDKVEKGDEVVITRRGTPIAKLTKTGDAVALSDAQQAARARLRNRMNEGFGLGGVVPDRASIHDRD